MEAAVPKEIRRGMRFTTSWANDKSVSWLLKYIVNNQAYLSREDGTVFTTHVNHLRVPINKSRVIASRIVLDSTPTKNGAQYLYDLRKAAELDSNYGAFDSNGVTKWRVIQSKYGSWSSAEAKVQFIERIKTSKQFLNEQLNKESMKLETTKEKVLEAAAKCPQAKTVLETMFPQVFEDDKVLCSIGSIFFRKQYPKNLYAIIKKGDRIAILNINFSTTWDEKKAIKIHALKDRDGKTITISEFRDLTGYVNMDEFIIFDKSLNNKLIEVVRFSFGL